jgi:hypothetical protein
MPKTPSFEEMFGVGSVPIASYFNLPEGASADTRFSPEARALLGQGEEYAREQAAREAELAAEELLGGAAGMSDEQIQQQLIQNPRMFGTQAIQPLSGYMQYRQSTSPMSDEVLGPVIEAKITDPYHKERFRNRMLQDGLSANDAYDAYLTDEYNNKFEVQLAEAGVPETEYGKLKTASGKFDPVAVPRAVAAAKAAAKLSGTGKRVAPVDEEVEFLKDAIEQRQKIFEATGRADKLAEDPVMADYISRYEKAASEKLTALRPPPKPVVGQAVQIPSLPVAVASNRPMSPQREQVQREEKTKNAEFNQKQQVADTEWTKQKQNLYQSIGRIYPDENRVLGIALDIADGVEIPVKTETLVDDFAVGETEVKRKLDRVIADELGVGLNDVAFVEPGNQRTGSQKVTYGELIREWAKEIKDRFEASQSQAGQPASSGAKIEIGSPRK